MRTLSLVALGATLASPAPAAQYSQIVDLQAPASPGTVGGFRPAVALSGHVAAIGGTECPESGGACAGALYLQARLASGTWGAAQTLSAAGYDTRGVGLSGDWAMTGGAAGATVVVRRMNGVWSEIQELPAVLPFTAPYLGEGNFVAVDGDRAIRGTALLDAPGRARVFERSGDSWIEVARLSASDGHAGDLFGAEVSISGDVALVGAQGHAGEATQHGQAPGAAYLFERQPDGTWIEVQKLEVPPTPWLDVGRSVSVSGATAVVGAGSPSPPSIGAAFVYERGSDGVWIETQRLQSIAIANHYGGSVSVSGERIAVGAATDDKAGPGHGAVYVYERAEDGSWERLKTVTSVTGTANAGLGSAVALDGGILFAIEDEAQAAVVFEDPVLPYGCGSNPADSLTVVGGSTSLGGTLVLGVDNPLGTQAAGSIPLLFASLAPLPGYPCGFDVPGLGMAAADAPGELLVGLLPGQLVATLAGPAWTGSGAPAPITVPIPDQAGLLGIPVFLQGALIDPTLENGVGNALTAAVEIRFE